MLSSLEDGLSVDCPGQCMGEGVVGGPRGDNLEDIHWVCLAGLPTAVCYNPDLQSCCLSLLSLF